MRTFADATLLALTFYIASAVSASTASQSPSSQRSRSESLLDSGSDDRLTLRDASTLLSGSYNNEGENHDPLWVPDGSELRNLAVGDQGDQLALFWSTNVNDMDSEHAFIMIHGKNRDANDYWNTMNSALQSALDDGYAGASPNSTVVSPMFFSKDLNSGEYTSNELAWGDVNLWQAGAVATHPSGTKTSSLDALDALIDNFANTTAFPNMKNVTLAAHGGGAQLAQRHAAIGRTPPPNIHVRWVVGDPSTSVYFTEDRQAVWESTIKDCDLYNTWRYGFEGFNGTLNGTMTPKQYFQSYINKDVVNLIGYQDTSVDGDQSCAALLQGGTARRNRNLSYFKYIHTLARTNYDVSDFFGDFNALPDWSDVSLNEVALRLIVIEWADHSADEVFGSDEGRAALFSSKTLPTGWRPSGWSAKGNGQDVQATHSSPPNPSPTFLNKVEQGQADAAHKGAPAHVAIVLSLVVAIVLVILKP